MQKTDAVAPGKLRNQQLREIDVALKMASVSEREAAHPMPSHFRGPAVARSMLHAIMAYFAVDGLAWLLRTYVGVHVDGLGFWLPVASAMVAYGVTLSKAPYKTWPAKIYALLAAYDPKDKAAYQLLQEDVRRYGLDRGRIQEWMSDEYRAIAAGMPPSMAKRDAHLHSKADMAELLETIERVDELLPQYQDQAAGADLLRIRDDLLPLLDQSHSGMPLSDEQRSQLKFVRDVLNYRMNAGLGPLAERNSLQDDPQKRFLTKQITNGRQPDESST